MNKQLDHLNVGHCHNVTATILRLTRRALLFALGLGSLILLTGGISSVIAETDLPHPKFTWNLNPSNGDWNTASNWMPAQVPDSTSQAAQFGSSSITDITASDTVHSVEFLPGAGQYTITGNLTFNAGGVINDSGVEQTFNGFFDFQKFGATVGPMITFNTTGIYFGKGTSGGNGTYINSGRISFFGGRRAVWYTTAGAGAYTNNGTISFHKADAGSSTFTNNGGATFGADGGLIEFTEGTSSASSTIINNGGAVFGGHGARCIFHRAAAADAATLIANGGAGPGSGATILFTRGTNGNTARVKVFGNGDLDISRPSTGAISIGSLEGDGLVFLGACNLTIGSNNLDTTFAGTISDNGGIHTGIGGSVSKNGTGTLTLTTGNTYAGGTTLQSGSLFANNTSDSGTGSGAVMVTGGNLGGTGTIAGAVTIGTGNGSGATLSPGANVTDIGTLTLQSTLRFYSDSTFGAQFNSTDAIADQVSAHGVTIDAGAEILLTDLGSSPLASGTSFVVLNNTAATPIAGTFANLADGVTLVVGSNTFTASYEGGDGNDLTLTVK